MQRWVVVLFAALLVPAFAPAGSSQVPTPGTTGPGLVKLLQDKTGDAVLDVGGTQQSPSGRWAAADLVSLSAQEQVDTIDLTVEAANLHATPEATFVEDTDYQVAFLVRDTLYRVDVFRQAGTQGGSYRAQLSQYDAGRDAFDLLDFSIPVDAAEQVNTFTVKLPRHELLDSNGSPPGPSIPLKGFHALVRAGPFGGGQGSVCVLTCTPFGGYSVTDRMPDSGNGTVPMPLAFGIVQTGHARLTSDVPIRSSNGEATTYVFQVAGHNLGRSKERFSLSATSVPSNWEVRLPARTLDIGGNGTVLFPVLVTTPFIHAHGTLQAFILELKSQADGGSVGRIQLGVRYAQPPQPAGHHNTLSLHSRHGASDVLNDAVDTATGNAGAILSMNAEPNDPLDDGSPVQGFACDTSPPTQGYCWSVPLSPGLDIGLDFDLAKAGELSVPFHSVLPLSGAQLSGELVYIPPHDEVAFSPRGGGGSGPSFPGFVPDGAIVVAQVQPSDHLDFGANTDGQILHATVKPTKAADYLPYRKGASLELELEVKGTGVPEFPFFGDSSFGPSVQSGGAMVLPLVEYHDKVEGLFRAVPTLDLNATSAQDRLVNPGRTALYNLTLTNRGAPATFLLDLTGTHLPWAAMVAPVPQDGQEGFQVGRNQTLLIKVRVTVPADAKPSVEESGVADIVLSATSSTDLNVRALARLVARIDTTTDHPDDLAAVNAISGGAKSTPGLGPCFALAGLAVALLAMRRKR